MGRNACDYRPLLAMTLSGDPSPGYPGGARAPPQKIREPFSCESEPPSSQRTRREGCAQRRLTFRALPGQPRHTDSPTRRRAALPQPASPRPSCSAHPQRPGWALPRTSPPPGAGRAPLALTGRCPRGGGELTAAGRPALTWRWRCSRTWPPARAASRWRSPAAGLSRTWPSAASCGYQCGDHPTARAKSHPNLPKLRRFFR